MKIKEAISRGLLTESEAKNIPVITRAELDVIIKESKKKKRNCIEASVSRGN